MGEIIRPLAFNFREALSQLSELPSMPNMAIKLMELRSMEEPDIGELCAVIELDPSIAAQLIRYGRSAFYGYRGKIESMQDAVIRVLGYEMAINVALGIATLRAFDIEEEGPLGLHQFWKEAIYVATLGTQLCHLMPRTARPKAGLVYIAGLLHNIGFLVLGHLFPREHQSLNRLVAERPDLTILEIEEHALRITHPETGAILLRLWKIMPEVTTAVLYHHNAQYQGEHGAYANLLLVADRLLRRVGLGDGDSGELPAAVLERLGLAEFQAGEALDRTLGLREPLDELVASLSAGR